MINDLFSSLVRLLEAFSYIILPLLAFHLLQQVFLLNIKQRPTKILKLYGVIAVPIHEISHAIMCVMFRHKIEEIKLLDWSISANSLGYVRHSYNSLSIFQVVGCFFIGIAPIFGGTFVAFILTAALLDNTRWLAEAIKLNDLERINGLETFIIYYAQKMQFYFEQLMIVSIHEPFKALIWFFGVGTLGLYLSPSMADLKGCFRGGIVIFILLTVIEYFSSTQLDYTLVQSVLFPFSIMLTLVLIVSAIMMLITLLLTNTVELLFSFKFQ